MKHSCHIHYYKKSKSLPIPYVLTVEHIQRKLAFGSLETVTINSHTPDTTHNQPMNTVFIQIEVAATINFSQSKV